MWVLVGTLLGTLAWFLLTSFYTVLETGEKG